MDVYEFTIIYTGMAVLTGLTVYLVFYVVFQKLAASKTPEQRDDVSGLIVMGGFVVDEPLRLSAIRILKDILRRALGRRVLRLESFSREISSWYLLALIFLAALVAASFLLGW
ncbi:hypothetical protein IMZ38_02925 [Thermosphaera chiliense]|uniref:Uncharacterized protein n=1 Tax=Thermosphaera chiliense TaxID=3402707 RepID=A0A7M1UTJ2_9CREN|nr:hypothetical protein [Thermosphaera aggregans]QOR94883.1 hypothetical protein IMZ38_02925 [Thermosphaera aggregans]